MTATNDFAIKHALRLETQLNTTPADLFGGSNSLVPTAGDQIPVEGTAEITKGSEFYTDAAANGTQFTGGKRKTAELPALSGLSVKGYTQGLERLLLGAMGYASPGGPAAVVSSSGFHSHLFCMPPQGRNQRPYTAAEQALVPTGFDADDRINTYLVVSQELGPYERSLRNVVIKDLELSCSAKNPLMLKVSGPAERIVKDTNKASSPSWSYPAGAFADWFQMSDCKCFIQPASVAFDGASVPVSITEMSVKVSHGISEDNVPTGTANGGLSRAEPLPTGKSSLSAELGVYLHDKTIYEDWEENGTVLHAKLEFTRGNYKILVLLPRLTVTLADPNFDGAGSVKLSLEAALPNDPAELAALASSFATERALSGTTQPWPATSLFGLIVVSKESKNPMRWN